MGGPVSILIGCDRNHILIEIIRKLQLDNFCNCISAVRISDVLNLARDIKPVVVILCFRNNQMALNNVNSFLKYGHTSVVCLTSQEEASSLHWPKNKVVFTLALEHSLQGTFLLPRIQSIVALTNKVSSDSAFDPNQGIPRRMPERAATGMSRYIMELDQKKRALEKIKLQLEKLYGEARHPLRQKLVSIANSIKIATNDHRHWDDFKLYFERINPNFITQLHAKHPDLTTKDVKYCCYMRMSMSNTDIGHLLGINLESVRTHKYRLKKKLDISRRDSLQNYINSFALVN
ncbi:MAG: hypothetical protein ABJM06_07895 [Gilvibacter sp.]